MTIAISRLLLLRRSHPGRAKPERCIGKTHAKPALVDATCKVLGDERLSNAIPTDGPYPQHGIDDVWTWMLAACRDFAQLTRVSEVVRLFCASWPTARHTCCPLAMQ